MKKLLTFVLAAASLATILPDASASTPVAPVTQSGPTVLPGTVLEAPLVIVEGRHRRYRRNRVVYYRHGRRVVVYRRVYY